MCNFVDNSEALAKRPVGHGRPWKSYKTFKGKLHAARFTDIARFRYCSTHKRKCEIKASKLRGGGTPCTDYSTIGNRAGVQGPTANCTIAWIVEAKHHDLSIHENVLPSVLLSIIIYNYERTSRCAQLLPMHVEYRQPIYT